MNIVPYAGFSCHLNVSFLTTFLCILIGYPLAYFLSQVPKKYVGLMMLTVLLPFWTSLLVRTYAWLVMLQRNGLINNFAIDLGIWDTPIKLAHNLNGTLIGMVHIMLPFLVLPLYAAMRRIDRQALQAAANLGRRRCRHSGKFLFHCHCQAWLPGRSLCLCCVLVFM